MIALHCAWVAVNCRGLEVGAVAVWSFSQQINVFLSVQPAVFLSPVENNAPVIRLRLTTTDISRSTDAGHFFQTSDALASSERKTAKAKNQRGGPIKLPSKVLAVHGATDGSLYVAEAAGEVKKIDLEVCENAMMYL